jgi:RimJ/RimL family protein N-acetyltransferase
MGHPIWPLFDLIVRTPRLELRAPNDDEIAALVAQADESIYANAGFMPFHIDWTGKPRESMQYFWGTRANWSAKNWTLSLVPFIDGEPVGNQALLGVNFPIVRRVSTGSWLVPSAQGHGVGTEMRAAALHLAFEGLGALEAQSEAHVDNGASNGVSRRLGYEVTHRESSAFGDQRGEIFNLLLRRTVWETKRRDDIEIIGLDRCLEMFGLEEDSGTSQQTPQSR